MGAGDIATDALKVYVRLPVKINEELEIKNLHPDIKTVQLPRQKSRRWCFIKFEDRETLEKVVNHLKTLQINNKKIIVKDCKQRKRRNATTPLAIPRKQGTVQPLAKPGKEEEN